MGNFRITWKILFTAWQDSWLYEARMNDSHASGIICQLFDTFGELTMRRVTICHKIICTQYLSDQQWQSDKNSRMISCNLEMINLSWKNFVKTVVVITACRENFFGKFYSWNFLSWNSLRETGWVPLSLYFWTNYVTMPAIITVHKKRRARLVSFTWSE